MDRRGWALAAILIPLLALLYQYHQEDSTSSTDDKQSSWFFKVIYWQIVAEVVEVVLFLMAVIRQRPVNRGADGTANATNSANNESTPATSVAKQSGGTSSATNSSSRQKGILKRALGMLPGGRHGRWVFPVLVYTLVLVVVATMNYDSLALSSSDEKLVMRQLQQLPPACQPKPGYRQHARSPILLFADQRTGSTLFFDFLTRLDQEAADHFSALPLFELFSPFEEAGIINNLIRLVKTMDQTCQHDNDDLQTTTTALSDRNMSSLEFQFETTQDFANFLKQQPPPSQTSNQHTAAAQTTSIVNSFAARLERPMELIQHALHVPADDSSSNAYFSFKVHSWQMDYLHTTVSRFVRQLNRVLEEHQKQQQQETSQNRRSSKPKYIVLWRRRLIESYVSMLIADKKKTWHRTETTADDAVHVNLWELAKFVRDKKNYYRQVKQTLDALEIDYAVFEYERDLLGADRQQRTVERLARFLEIVPAEDTAAAAELAQAVLDESKQKGGVRKKQASVPLKDQVENWNAVTWWGYGGDTDEWEDLFPGK